MNSTGGYTVRFMSSYSGCHLLYIHIILCGHGLMWCSCSILFTKNVFPQDVGPLKIPVKGCSNTKWSSIDVVSLACGGGGGGVITCGRGGSTSFRGGSGGMVNVGGAFCCFVSFNPCLFLLCLNITSFLLNSLWQSEQFVSILPRVRLLSNCIKIEKKYLILLCKVLWVKIMYRIS